MSDFKTCGECKACKHFNGENGSGYQPCHRPPEYVPPPLIQILYSDEPSVADRWTSGFYFGVFIGIGIGLVTMKLLTRAGL
ncbi:hypothetical protein [Acinetobacter pittii]|uniref:hypothetical protein n=1 Tax=Acinetobacter pittii TaxID=48296 RepID=UPI001EEBC458|nr:hypothetical protein [Acinetobacter pittii]